MGLFLLLFAAPVYNGEMVHRHCRRNENWLYRSLWSKLSERERKRERKKNTLKLPFIKGLSLTFPLFIFFLTMTCFWPWKFLTVFQRWRFFYFHECFSWFLILTFCLFFKVVSEEAEKHQVHPQPWPQGHDLGAEDRDLGPSADQSRTDENIPRGHPWSSVPDHASPSPTTNPRLTAKGRLAEEGVSEYPGAKRTGSERWDDLHEFHYLIFHTGFIWVYFKQLVKR